MLFVLVKTCSTYHVDLGHHVYACHVYAHSDSNRGTYAKWTRLNAKQFFSAIVVCNK